jgi:uncharacterized protein YdhG (YjbR/CyaY superfamily)
MGINSEDAKSFEDMAKEMDRAPEEVAETTETVVKEATEEATEEVADNTTDEIPV